jgi:biopolymer transport protein ExbD
VKRFSQRGVYNPVADINIVPMMDLVWNLLIVFMLTAPLLENSIDIKLPHSASGSPSDSKDMTTINLDSAGRAFVNERQMSLSEIQELAREKIGNNPQHGVLVRGDEKVPYGKFIEIVDTLKRAGVSKLGMVGLAGSQPKP